MNGFPHSVVFRTSSPFPPPPRRSEIEMLDQLIQQSPDAVVLFRRAGYRFVTHGAHAAHLKPLHQAPVRDEVNQK